MPRPSTGPTSPASRGRGSAGGPTPSVAARVTGLDGPLSVEADKPSRLFLGASYAFGIFAGVVLGVYGATWVPVGPRLGTFLFSLGVVVALVGNTGVALLTRWLTGTRLGAVVLLIGWAPVALAFGSARPEGDLILRATIPGYLFLGLGLLAPIVVSVVGRARRGLTALTLPPPGP